VLGLLKLTPRVLKAVFEAVRKRKVPVILEPEYRDIRKNYGGVF
jgi:hypothetical protein